MAQFEWVQSGEVDCLDRLRLNWNASSLFQMRLFTSTTVVDHNPTIANFVEASFTGYMPATLNTFQLPTHPSASSHAVSNVGTDPVFNNNSGVPQNVLGIFNILNEATPILLGWGFFLSSQLPITIQDGSSLTVPSSASIQTIFEHTFS